MKILIVSDAWHPQVNGVVRTYEGLIPELTRMGHTVKVIGPSDFRYTMPLPGYPEIRLTLWAYTPLSRMILAESPDLLHIATEGPLGVAARRYALARGMRFTTCFHTQFPDYVATRAAAGAKCLYAPVRRGAIAFVRWFHRPSACVFVATQTLKNTLLEWGFTAPIKFMTRGIDFSVFHAGTKTKFGDLKRPVALYVGRVAIEKNIPDFLDMPWPGAKVIVGHGPDLEKLKKAYPDVVFTGKKTGAELAACYQSADIFVFPSRTDTFGMVVTEALACGVPVAAYPVTGPKDIVDRPALGCLDNDLAGAARACLANLTAEAAAVRETHMRALYTWEKAARQFLELETL